MYFYPYTYTRRAESTVINVMNVMNRKGRGVYHVCHVYHAIFTFVRVLAAARLFVRCMHRLHAELVVNGSFPGDPSKGNSRLDSYLVTGTHKGGSAFWGWLRVNGGLSAWGVSDEPV